MTIQLPMFPPPLAALVPPTEIRSLGRHGGRQNRWRRYATYTFLVNPISALPIIAQSALSEGAA
jgi:hypothetical protein